MVAFDQRNPHHCYDLFLHTMHTVAGIKETAPALLRVAAFFHDIGKPIVAVRITENSSSEIIQLNIPVIAKRKDSLETWINQNV